MADDFLSIGRNEQKLVSEYLSKAHADKVENNRKVLISIIDVCLLVNLAKGGIPLRGNWCKDQHEDDINFMFFVKWKAEDNDSLAPHLKNAPCNARYLSPNTQNECIRFLVLPVGSCSCERSFSALRRLKTWWRASTKEYRLNGLALAHTHRQHPLLRQLDPVRIFKAWDGSLHRKILLAFDD